MKSCKIMAVRRAVLRKRAGGRGVRNLKKKKKATTFSKEVIDRKGF